MYNIEKLTQISREVRKDIINLTYKSGSKGAHIGGGLSMPEILTALYFDVMNVSSDNPTDKNRDRFILSKGHGAVALYAVLKHAGYISQSDLDNFKKNGSIFWTHPSKNINCGIEISSGSLGLGLSYGAGIAYSMKKNNSFSKVYVYLGDGECDEGSIWEAASFASHNRLDNLIAIVDENRIQLDDMTENIINKDNLGERFKAFGFSVNYADGHNIQELINTFKISHKDKPQAVIARTVKGKGVSFIENNPEWHVKMLTDEQYKKAIAEQEQKDAAFIC